MKQITNNAVEYLGLTNWHKEKIGALVLILSKEKGKKEISKDLSDSMSIEASTKENSIDDIDEGIIEKKQIIPSFNVFHSKIQCTKVDQHKIVPQLKASRPGIRLKNEKFLTPRGMTKFNSKRLANAITQVNGKGRINNAVKSRAFKNLKFGDEQSKRTQGKRESEQNINFHFWLTPRDCIGCTTGMKKNILVNSLTNKINVVINEALSSLNV